MKCPICGKEIAENSKSCPICGAEIKQEPAQETEAPKEYVHKNRFEGCPSIEGNANPTYQAEEPVKRHGFISFWLGLILVGNVWSIIKTAREIMDGDMIVINLIIIALGLVVIFGVSKLFKAEKFGFWLVVGASVVDTILAGFISIAFGAGIVLVVASIIGAILRPVILWAILQIRKDGKSYWSQLK